MYLAVVYHFGAPPGEGSGDVEDGRDEEVAFGVDVAPQPDEYRGKAVGELVGVLEAGVDDQVAVDVSIAVEVVFLYQRQTVVVDVGFAAIAAVVVFDGEYGVAHAVDNAPFAVAGDVGAAVLEHAGVVVLAGDDLFAVVVEVAVFAVALHEDALFAFAYELGVDGFGEGLEAVVVQRQSVVVAGKEVAFVHGGENLIFDGEDFAALAVNHAVAVVVFHHCVAFGEGECVLERGLDDGVAEVVDKAVGDKFAVDVFGYDGHAFGEGRGGWVAEGDALASKGVEITVEGVALHHDETVGGIEHLLVDAGDYFHALAVDEAAAVVIHVHLAVVAMEFVDEEVFVGHDDGAVFAFEAEAVAALCGLDAVDEYEFAAAFFVVDIFHILLRPRGMGEENGGDE